MEGKVIPSIALNAFKGGVSKTTTSFNLAWYFTGRNAKVLLVDLDPQCNLSQLFLEDQGEEVSDRVFRENRPDAPEEPFVNIGEGLTAMTNSQPLPSVQTLCHSKNKNLYLLAGSLSVTDYEENLAVSETMKASFTKNIPGALYHLIQKTARECGADLIVIDTSPSMGCLNMVVVMCSNYFIIPCQADFFSLQALKSARKRIAEVGVGNRGHWIQRMNILRQYTSSSPASLYPLPAHTTKFLGVVAQMFTIKRGKVTAAFQHYINEIEHELINHLVPTLLANDMAFEAEVYHQVGLRPYIVAKVQNFNRFGPMAQEQGLPLIALLEDDKRFVSEVDGDTKSRKSLNGFMLNAAKTDVTRMVKPFKQAGRAIFSLIGLSGIIQMFLSICIRIFLI